MDKNFLDKLASVLEKPFETKCPIVDKPPTKKQGGVRIGTVSEHEQALIVLGAALQRAGHVAVGQRLVNFGASRAVARHTSGMLVCGVTYTLGSDWGVYQVPYEWNREPPAKK